MINCIGSLFGQSGYDIHFRQLVNALNKLIPCKITTNLHPNWLREVNDQELEMIKRKEDYEVNLIITHPIFWRINAYAKKNITYLVWEGDRIPESFIKECLNPNIHKIIVPSKHTEQALLNTLFQYHKKLDQFDKNELGTTIFNSGLWHYRGILMWDKIIIIPHGVDSNLFYPKETKKDKFTFLMNKGLRNLEDRGGIQYGIKAYLEEFTDKDNVRMIVKINSAYGIPDIDNLIKQITDKKENLPEFLIDLNNYQYNEMINFYNKGDVFISPTRAEAFNLPCIEAMSCGLPIITTDFGGQAEYAIGCLIPYTLAEVKHEVQYEGINWAIPDIDALKKSLREAYNGNLRNLREQCISKAKEMSWDKTAQEILKLI
jgi:glycosyltransferase involved in cell wall biosynthesis